MQPRANISNTDFLECRSTFDGVIFPTNKTPPPTPTYTVVSRIKGRLKCRFICPFICPLAVCGWRACSTYPPPPLARLGQAPPPPFGHSSNRHTWQTGADTIKHTDHQHTTDTRHHQPTATRHHQQRTPFSIPLIPIFAPLFIFVLSPIADTLQILSIEKPS